MEKILFFIFYFFIFFIFYMKSKTIFVCNSCGGTSPKWQGQCQQCGEWNTLVEENIVNEISTNNKNKNKNNRFQALAVNNFDGIANKNKIQKLGEIQTKVAPRLLTGLSELDRAFGGGLVQGGITLIGGDPGIGKSTLLLQVLAHLLEKHNCKVLYVSGEESPEQIALRAKRLELNADDLPLLAEINLEKILNIIQNEQPQIVVIDSIQTLWSDVLSSAPGSVAQVRECAAQLTRLAKTQNITVILVGHVTKEGSLAGPRILEHMVDTVLYFEGDAHLRFRLLRAVKNRFGAVNELGVFAMTEVGLKGVGNPSAIFLSQHEENVAGTSILVTQEGSRPLLVEIQALLDESHTGNARRLTVGLEAQRLSMLLAVLHRHAGVQCSSQDVFINAVGGVRISEPAADLAVILSIVSSLKNQPLPSNLVVFGEIGLAGEVRPAPRGQERLKEAAKLGFTKAILPFANMPSSDKFKIKGMQLFPVKRIDEAVEIMRNL